MAFIEQDLTEEEKKKLEGAGGAPGGQAASALLGPSGGAPPDGAVKPSSSGWTNLRTYLDANKEQGVGLSDQVAGQVNTQGEDAKKSFDTSTQDYSKRLAASAPGDVSGLIQTASDNPSGIVSSADDYARFKALQSGVFSGPSPFDTEEGYALLQKKASDASDLGDFAQSEGGQRELIRGISPSQTAGELDLNQLIVSGNPEARGKITQAAEPYSGLRTELSNYTDSAKAERDKNIADVGVAKDRIETEFNAPKSEYYAGVESDLNSRGGAASTEDFNLENYIASLNKAVSGQGDLTTNEYSQFGITRTNPNGITKYELEGENKKVATEYSAKRAISDYTGRSASPYEIEWVGKILRGEASPNTPEQYQYGTPDDIKKLWYDIQDLFKNSIYNGQPSPSAYNFDPLAYVREQGGDAQSLIEKYFPGTTKSSGTPSAAGMSSPEEVANYLALQKLLEGENEFLTDEDLARAGTYKGASIGKLKLY